MSAKKSKDNYGADAEHESGSAGCIEGCDACYQADKQSYAKHTRKPAHTPLPWRTASIKPRNEGPLTALVGDANEDSVHIGTIRSKEDAAFIVRAVNIHDELVFLLKNSLGNMDACWVCNEIVHDSDCLLIKTIAKAEGR